jgi:hypothetical protein
MRHGLESLSQGPNVVRFDGRLLLPRSLEPVWGW